MHSSVAFRRSFWTPLALVLFPAGLAAQSGSIAGVVRAQDAAVEAEAGLAAVQVDALRTGDDGVVQTVLTNEEGRFRVFLPAGTYDIAFSAPGWETRRERGVVVEAGQTTSLDIRLAERAFDLNPITVTASKTEEKALDAPNAVNVVSTRDVAEQPAVTVADHVRDMASVDVIKTGIQGNYIVVRGFNNIFSGATMTLTDNRIASVPSLRANVLHLNPTSNLDIERVEVVLGPGSALYGPNAANGVIHSITKSPIDYPGGTLAVSMGVREQGDQSFSFEGVDLDGDGVTEDLDTVLAASTEPFYHVEGRYGLRLSEHVGVKVSSQFFLGEEYGFIDQDELEQEAIAQRCQANPVTSNQACRNFGQGLGGTAEDIEVLFRSVDNVASGRDNQLERWAVDMRADWRPTDELGFIVSGGRSTAGNSVDLTGLGAAQVQNWGYYYGQARALWRDLFAQVFFNKSANEDTYLLRTGRPLIDRSSMVVGQVQNTNEIGRHRLIYGVDLLRTVPQTDGTINGQHEDDDDVTEFGGYAQTLSALSSRFELILAARVDAHSRLEEPVFSPRAALVYKPSEGQSLRLTYNRAFSTPTTLNLFLDISGGSIPLGGPFRYDVRAQGTTESGLSFAFDENGVPLHQSPFAPLFGASSSDRLPTTTEQVWDEIVALVRLNNQPLGDQLAMLEPTSSDIGIDVRLLNLTSRRFETISEGLAGIRNNDPVRPTITSTFETGYKGLIGQRLLLGANAYYSIVDDFTSPLRLISPNIFLNPNDVEQFLLANGFSAEQAAALGVTIGGNGDDVPGIPVGVITPVGAGGVDPALVLTYSNLDRFELWGGDVSLTVILNNQWELEAGYAHVSDDEFVITTGSVSDTIALNAATNKATGSVRYRNDELGFNGQFRGRWVDSFPANSGVYVGTVDALNIFDLTLGYELPFVEGVTAQLDVQNLFDADYQTYVGTPELGRMTILRLKYDF